MRYDGTRASICFLISLFIFFLSYFIFWALVPRVYTSLLWSSTAFNNRIKSNLFTQKQYLYSTRSSECSQASFTSGSYYYSSRNTPTILDSKRTSTSQEDHILVSSLSLLLSLYCPHQNHLYQNIE